jgi:hypothetical protein
MRKQLAVMQLLSVNLEQSGFHSRGAAQLEHQAVFLCCTLSPSRSPPKRPMTAPQPLWRDAAVSVEPFSGGVYRFHFHTAKEPLDVCPGAKPKPQEFRLPEGFARLQSMKAVNQNKSFAIAANKNWLLLTNLKHAFCDFMDKI